MNFTRLTESDIIYLRDMLHHRDISITKSQLIEMIELSVSDAIRYGDERYQCYIFYHLLPLCSVDYKKRILSSLIRSRSFSTLSLMFDMLPSLLYRMLRKREDHLPIHLQDKIKIYRDSRSLQCQL